MAVKEAKNLSEKFWKWSKIWLGKNLGGDEKNYGKK